MSKTYSRTMERIEALKRQIGSTFRSQGRVLPAKISR